jgi:quercetin dioxygenase-like cupin family protein
MAQSLVEDPVRRQRYRFSRQGEVLRAEVWADPGGDVPAHFHPIQEERFEVLAGEVRFRVGRRAERAGPGSRVVAPPGVRHSFKNTGGTEAHLLVEVEPALGLQQFLEEAATLARAGKYTRHGMPKGLGAALELAELIDRHREVTVMAFPPPAVQRVMISPLARLERRRRARRAAW